RRWSIVREEMGKRGLDAIIVHGANNRTGVNGYFTWFTGISAPGANPQSIIFPREGEMTIIRHGAFGEVRQLDPNDVLTPGIGRVRGTPTFPAVHYTMHYDADIMVEELERGGYRSVAWVSPQSMYYGFASALSQRLGGKIADITDFVDEVKAVKSPFEIGMLRAAARMQDEILDALGGIIQPGMRDFEVMAEAQRLGERKGSQTGVFLGASIAPDDLGVPVRYRPEQGRTIREGDLFFMLVENTGPGGMYTHVSRYFALGTPPQALVDALSSVAEAQNATLDMLVPGASSADVFAEYNAGLTKRGFHEEARLHAHGQGYDLVERPLIRSDEPMRLAAGMNIGVHAGLFSGKTFATTCDNYLLTQSGPERLHQYPQTPVVQI
ncbi:MAG TPA: M24 family metallopeptidase, partial [Sphingobium sp.]|nr:M24 family metallopeptidase [Sphingobium sp.]